MEEIENQDNQIITKKCRLVINLKLRQNLCFNLIIIFRLSSCEVCGGKDAIYTCPKCELKTCSLSCVKIHKKELNCDGVRDRTRFVYIDKFTDLDLFNDYKLLEECSRFVYGKKKNKEKRFTQTERYLPSVSKICIYFYI